MMQAYLLLKTDFENQPLMKGCYCARDYPYLRVHALIEGVCKTWVKHSKNSPALIRAVFTGPTLKGVSEVFISSQYLPLMKG